jgi:regulatory protein spx
MVIFWGVKGCLGCKKTREFLQKNKIEYIEKDFTKEPFTREELMDILSLTENGFDDIISPRSIAYKKIKKNINNMKFSELVDFIIKNPDVVHRPIILQYVNKKPLRLLIGFNSNDMNILL